MDTMYLLLLSFGHVFNTMSVQNESNAKEVSIVKRSTKMDSEDFVSIQLKSSEYSIDELLSKAMNAATTPTTSKSDKKLGIQWFFLFFINNIGDDKIKKINLGLAIKHACSKFRELIQNPKFYDKDTVEEMR